ncbi:MAG: tRNA threonylcarbamoyladenosine dehydratase [Myxococcota bacterium]
MDEQAYQQRFSGIGRLYGLPAMEALARAHVAVVGIGGVGSWAVEALARSGVGRLTLIDLDDICVHNTNRQLHTHVGTIGQQKADVMAARAKLINPDVEACATNDFFTASSAHDVLAPGYDYVVDAIDDLDNKVLLVATCKALGIPVVTVGGAGGRRDPSKITIDDLSQSTHDGLLKRVRRDLRHHHGFPESGGWQVPSVFSRERAVFPTDDGGVCEVRDRSKNLKLDCSSGFGTATFVTGTFGFMAASVVVRHLSG